MNEVNPHLAQRLQAIQQALLAQHSAGRGLPAVVAGSERETFLREFLQKVFPGHRRFATGVITDPAGNLSGQVDIAVEYGFTPSFPMPVADERLLLAESVALVIEVKSDLIRQWGEVEAATRRVRVLRRNLEVAMHFSDAPLPDRIPVAAVGYTGHKTIEGVDERLRTTPEDSRPDAALVVDSGCFVGFGVSTSGALGLYGLCLGINAILNQIGFAHPNLAAYLQRRSSA